MEYWVTSVLILVLLAVLMVIWHPKIRKYLGLGLARDIKRDLWLTILGIFSIMATHTFVKAITGSETRAKYVELGAGILRSEPRKKAENETAGKECPELSIDEELLRTWAYKLVDTYSDVRMDGRTKRALICRGLKIIIGTGNIQEAPDTGDGSATVK